MVFGRQKYLGNVTYIAASFLQLGLFRTDSRNKR